MSFFSSRSLIPTIVFLIALVLAVSYNILIPFLSHSIKSSQQQQQQQILEDIKLNHQSNHQSKSTTLPNSRKDMPNKDIEFWNQKKQSQIECFSSIPYRHDQSLSLNAKVDSNIPLKNLKQDFSEDIVHTASKGTFYFCRIKNFSLIRVSYDEFAIQLYSDDPQGDDSDLSQGANFFNGYFPIQILPAIPSIHSPVTHLINQKKNDFETSLDFTIPSASTRFLTKGNHGKDELPRAMISSYFAPTNYFHSLLEGLLMDYFTFRDVGFSMADFEDFCNLSSKNDENHPQNSQWLHNQREWSDRSKWIIPHKAFGSHITLRELSERSGNVHKIWIEDAIIGQSHAHWFSFFADVIPRDNIKPTTLQYYCDYRDYILKRYKIDNQDNLMMKQILHIVHIDRLKDRTLVNMEEVHSYLKSIESMSNGMIKVTLTNLEPGEETTIEKNIKTYRDADIVSCVTGASNANLIFMKPESVLINLLPNLKNQKVPHYWDQFSEIFQYKVMHCQYKGPNLYWNSGVIQTDLFRQNVFVELKQYHQIMVEAIGHHLVQAKDHIDVEKFTEIISQIKAIKI